MVRGGTDFRKQVGIIQKKRTCPVSGSKLNVVSDTPDVNTNPYYPEYNYRVVTDFRQSNFQTLPLN